MMAKLAIVSLVSMVMSLSILIHTVSIVSPIVVNFPVCFVPDICCYEEGFGVFVVFMDSCLIWSITLLKVSFIVANASGVIDCVLF